MPLLQTILSLYTPPHIDTQSHFASFVLCPKAQKKFSVEFVSVTPLKTTSHYSHILPLQLPLISIVMSSVTTSNWRFVELGRVVLIDNKELATIVEIIDQKRVLIDGPNVSRQAIALAKVVLTPLVLPNLPRGARSTVVAKKWAAAEIDGKWAKTSWAKKLASRSKRAQLSDFERFQVLVLKKQRRFAVNKALAKA